MAKKDRSRDLLFEDYYNDKENLKGETFRERVFISYLDGMTEYHKFEYLDKIGENTFLGKMEDEKVLITIFNKGKVNIELEGFRNKLSKIASELSVEHKVEKTYCLHVKPAGESELILLSRLMLN